MTLWGRDCCPGEVVVLCACVMYGPLQVGVTVCPLVFVFVFRNDNGFSIVAAVLYHIDKNRGEAVS